MTAALIGFAAIFALALMRLPLAFAMGLVGFTGIGLTRGWQPALASAAQVVYETGFAYTLSVIPLFILMGNFATQGGISRALFEFASVVMSRFRGGLAMAGVLACAAFGAICGSSVATAATITQVALPEMRRHGYSGRLATGTLAAGGTLGILIPPSVPLVIYAILAEQNIAKLFAAAMVPGIIAMLGYIGVVGLIARRNPELAPPSEALPMAERWRAFSSPTARRSWKTPRPARPPRTSAAGTSRPSNLCRANWKSLRASTSRAPHRCSCTSTPNDASSSAATLLKSRAAHSICKGGLRCHADRQGQFAPLRSTP